MKIAALYQHVYILYVTVLFTNLFTLLIGFSKFDLILGVLSGIMFLIAFPKSTHLFKALGVSFTLIGTILYMTSTLEFLKIITTLKENLPILTLFMMLSWMNSIAKSGRYDNLLNKIMKVNTKNLGSLYNKTSLATFSLATFLNLPAIDISQDMIKSNLKSYSDKFINKFINMTSVRSYAIALLWSPLEVVVALVIFVVDIKYIQVFPWLLLSVVFIFFIDNLSGNIKFKKNIYTNTQHFTPFTKYDIKKLIFLISMLLLFLLSIITITYFNVLDFMTTVSLLIFPFSFAWATIIKRSKRFLAIGWPAWKKSVNNMNNFVVLFISLALFSGGITNSALTSHINNFIISFVDFPFLLMIFIQVFVLFMTLIGVHPTATIGIFSGIIGPLTKVIEPVSLAIILIVSSVSTFASSTYGILVTMTSFNTNQNPYKITLANIIFTLILGTFGTLLAYLLMKLNIY